MTAANLKPPAPPPGPIVPPASKPPARPAWTLKDVSGGRREVAIRLLLAGTEGIGKTTFAAGAPKPIFLCAEEGSNQLDVQRFPAIATWTDAQHAVDLLLTEKHEFQTLVIDTVDHLEAKLWEYICLRDNKRNKAGVFDIEAYGFGKGYVTALDEMRRFLGQLERLRAKNIHVLQLAHTHIKPFKNPLGDDFDRYELKLHAKTAGLLKEWSDAVLFAQFEQFAVKEDDRSRAKGFSNGRRVVHTERTAGYDAKNRFGLPPTIALSWDEFVQAVKNGAPVPTERLVAQIQAGIPLLAPEDQEKCKAALGRAGSDGSKLSQLLNLVNVKSAEQAAKES